jgi:RNA polymerase sigma-70 factor (ECF subfamily)
MKLEENLSENLPKLRKYISSKVSERGDAEEILQETLISINESFSFFKADSLFLTWACGIANHEIADFYRKKKIKTLLFSRFPFLEEIAHEALTPDESLEKKELGKEVKKVLSELTEGYSQILRLKYYQGFSMVEIAERLKTSVKAVESRLSRAREAFRLEWRKISND